MLKRVDHVVHGDVGTPGFPLRMPAERMMASAFIIPNPVDDEI
jgi:hypothetical protein